MFAYDRTGTVKAEWFCRINECAELLLPTHSIFALEIIHV